MSGLSARIDTGRLLDRLRALARIGGLPEGGCSRIALTPEDKAGRDLVVSWMRELGLEVHVDPIGNVFAVPPGTGSTPVVMTGSHIDTVRTGGIYDGNLGVLAGLEVIRTLKEAGIKTRHPIGVAFFTNEEGTRFQPDMMGSLVYTKDLAVAEARAQVGTDGVTVGDALDGIGYAGKAQVGGVNVRAFVEYHIEQGPILEAEGVTIGVVNAVQGFYWTEFTLDGQSNHAGTTPMTMRQDAGYAACRIAADLHDLADQIGDGTVITVGCIRFEPDVVNVIPRLAVFTVDMRNHEAKTLATLESRVHALVGKVAAREKLKVAHRSLTRFEPVKFDPAIVDRVEKVAKALGHSTRRMPSGAGHDAQAIAPHVPTAMIFVPSVRGISHDPTEHTGPKDIEAGANVLLHVLHGLANA